MLLSKILTLFLFSGLAFGATVPAAQSWDVKTDIAKEIQKKYPEARIEVTQGLERLYAAFLMSVSRVALETDEAGMAVMRLEGSETKNVRVAYHAWVKVPVPKKRILPRSALNQELFVIQEVDIASGIGRQYRGVLLPVDTNFEGLESIQTLLEQQAVLTTAVQKAPDVRPGSQVQIRVISGQLTLSTSGVAQEMATIGSQVRVTTAGAKKELVGKLTENKIVEVVL